MKTVILIGGLARSGKDTISDAMINKMLDKGFNVSKLSFAEPMKEILADTFSSDCYKVNVDTINLMKNNADEYFVRGHDYNCDDVMNTDMRQILQRFGTEAMKKQFGDDVWVELAYKKLHTDFTIISDWRFKAEWQYLINRLDVKVVSIKVFGDMAELKEDAHISEKDLKHFQSRYNIKNLYNQWSSTERQIDDIIKDLQCQGALDAGYELTPEIDYFKCLKGN